MLTMETTEMMEMMEMRECCICMDNPASLQCLHCSYVFCESCCQKLAIHNHIGRCIHCKSQRPWIKSVDPNAVLSENISLLGTQDNNLDTYFLHLIEVLAIFFESISGIP